MGWHHPMSAVQRRNPPAVQLLVTQAILSHLTAQLQQAAQRRQQRSRDPKQIPSMWENPDKMTGLGRRLIFAPGSCFA